MGTLRKLKRSGRESRKRFEYIPWDVAPPVRPMSEVLSEFAEPLLEGEPMDDKHLRAVLCMAALAWNMAALPPIEQNSALDELFREKAVADALPRHEIDELLRFLVARKKAMYGDDDRLILNYTFVEEEGNLRLLVASTPLQ